MNIWLLFVCIEKLFSICGWLILADCHCNFIAVYLLYSMVVHALIVYFFVFRVSLENFVLFSFFISCFLSNPILSWLSFDSTQKPISNFLQTLLSATFSEILFHKKQLFLTQFSLLPIYWLIDKNVSCVILHFNTLPSSIVFS